MNFVWIICVILSLLLLIFNQSTDVLNVVNLAMQQSLSLCLSLGIIYIFWCGILEILENLGFGKFIAKLLSPLFLKLFPNQKQKTLSNIATNISANMLGFGNASLPAGIKAIEEMGNDRQQNQSLLICLNCISLQIFPTTMLSLYSGAGGKDGFLLAFIGVTISLICAILCVIGVKLFFRFKKNK